MVVDVFFPKSFDVLSALIFIMEAIDIEKNNKVFTHYPFFMESVPL